MGATRPLAALALVAASWWFPRPGGAASPQRFRILTSQAGVYQVSFDSLARAGLPRSGTASAGLGLTSAGRPVPLAVEDGGDGKLGPGDHLEFVATHLRGEASYHHELAKANVHWLELGSGGPRIEDVSAEAPPGAAATLLRRLHLEQDRVMIRLSSRDRLGGAQPELWFWSKLTHLADPLRLPLDLTGLEPASARSIELRASFRGLSYQNRARYTPTGLLPDHTVVASLQGQPLRQASWDGRAIGALEDRLPAASLTPGPAWLELRVPRRTNGSPRDPIIDVVMLNWIEVAYPHDGTSRTGQVELSVASPEGAIELELPAGGSTALYGDTGRRFRLGASRTAVQRLRLARDVVAESFWLTEGPLPEPLAVELDEPSDWSSSDHQADYLMIVHHRLAAEAERLAAFHRGRGLTVAVADVQDLYDEFNHGVPHPRALRDFIARARHGWRPPAPRFVLLVGDASWDPHNALVDDARYADWVDRQLLAPGDGFRARQMTPYHEGPALNERNLVPSVATLTTFGQAAVDDWYVADDLDELLPAVAIGRLPVTEPAEMAAIVDKTIASASAPVGPWRRSVLWITNEEATMQQFTDRAVARLAARGFVPTKVYPRPEERSNAGHQQRILDSLAKGQSLVQFTGHGGRFIWRTGPPDPLKNHDLFTLEHLDALAPSDRLPVVVSHSCHTAPFDHPSADSIGERFLRLADRGAPAVVAASWRIVPLPELVEGFAGELARPGTVGEALARAKRSLASPELTATYNLLGDPALPTPVPQHELVLELLPAATDAPRRLSARLPAGGFRGRVRVEWLDEGGASLAHEERGLEGVQAFFAPPALDGLRWASVYFWDEESGFDAVGGLDLLLSSPQPSASP